MRSAHFRVGLADILSGLVALHLFSLFIGENTLFVLVLFALVG